MTTEIEALYPTNADIQKAMQELFKKEIAKPELYPPLLDLHNPADDNPAIQHCVKAYSMALMSALKTGRDRDASSQYAEDAYRNAIPPLYGQKNIRNYIACVGFGMLFKAIDSAEGARLLYAAQVAYSAHNVRTNHSLQKVRQKRIQNASGSTLSDTQLQ